MLPSLVQKWRCEKWSYQSSSISWMTVMAIQAKGRVFCPKSKLNGSLLRGKQTLLGEMANDSEARLGNLGIELGTGPMLGRDLCWGQEDSRGEMLAQQGRRRWWLTGSNWLPGQTLTQHWRWLYCCPSSAAAWSSSQHSLESIGFMLAQASQGSENLISNIVVLTIGVLEMQRWKVAEGAKTWKFLNWIIT